MTTIKGTQLVAYGPKVGVQFVLFSNQREVNRACVAIQNGAQQLQALIQ